MKKKGFTLVELMAVIILLGVIALIAYPTITSTVNNAKQKSYEETIRQIEYAASRYGNDNYNELPKISDSEVKKISIAKLIQEGYIRKTENGKILNPIDNSEMAGCVSIQYSEEYSQYIYTYISECEVPNIAAKPEKIYINLGEELDVTTLFDISNAQGVECSINKTSELSIGVHTITCTATGLDNITATSEKQIMVGYSLEDKIESLLYENNICKTNDVSYEYMGGCYLKENMSIELKNYVWYSGFIWRIMGINADGSIRLITEENVTGIPYNLSSSDFNKSHIDMWLNEYFYEKIGINNDTNVIEGNFCQNVMTDTSITRNNCENGTVLKRKVGLLSIDEYNLAGGNNSYLNNAQNFWTMSSFNDSSVWSVNEVGNFSGSAVTYANGIRPIININNLVIMSGSGTLKDYYILGDFESENIEFVANTKIGEYVSFANKIYRVVENNELGTKLILDGYYQEENNNYYMKYGIDNEFTITNRNETDSALQGIGYKLNTDVLNWLTNNDKELEGKIKLVSWYQNNIEPGESYQLALNEINPLRTVIAKVGLIREGEILSGQSYTMLTKNGTTLNSINNLATFWILSSSDTTSAWYVSHYGYNYSVDVSNGHALRPTIVIDSNLVIRSGNGTANNPYEIKIDD